MSIRMGFEGKIYYGVTGSEATTLLENAIDVGINIDSEKAPTTVRGDGSTPPVNTEQVVALTAGIEFSMIHDTTDSALEALRTAAAAGTPVAIRMKDEAAGKGFNGDVTLGMKVTESLKGEQKIDFSASPTKQSGRTPSLYT